jgi:hypothetical protein
MQTNRIEIHVHPYTSRPAQEVSSNRVIRTDSIREETNLKNGRLLLPARVHAVS